MIKDLRTRGAEVFVTAKDVGEQVFVGHGLVPAHLQEGDSRHIEPLLSREWGATDPDLVFTSATSLPILDMTEKNLWRWARAKGIASVAVLDQWQNYAKRFSSPGTSDLAFLPDMCCVMDEIARRGMVEEGFPSARLAITGQPAFDALAGSMQAEVDAALALKRDLGMDNGRPTLVFVAESLRNHWRDEYGYDERTSLNDLLDIIEELPELPNLIVKKHPQNVDEDFDLGAIQRVSDRVVVRIVGTEHPAKRVILASDIVVGMSSVLLVESILLGKVTVSIEIGAKVFNKCFPVDIGVIPSIVEKEAARKAICRLISSREFRTEWMARQSKLGHLPGATQRVSELVLALAKM
ncbi:MAG: hypothetical protein K9J74_00220 [Sulfuritalea sp.]|nr:hypothetical protein [Sulfuritalea sp.]